MKKEDVFNWKTSESCEELPKSLKEKMEFNEDFDIFSQPFDFSHNSNNIHFVLDNQIKLFPRDNHIGLDHI